MVFLWAEKTVEEETAAESDLFVFGIFDGRLLPYGPGVGIDDIAAGETMLQSGRVSRIRTHRSRKQGEEKSSLSAIHT